MEMKIPLEIATLACEITEEGVDRVEDTGPGPEAS